MVGAEVPDLPQLVPGRRVGSGISRGWAVVLAANFCGFTLLRWKKRGPELENR